MRPADDLCSAIGSFEVTRDPARSLGAVRGNLRYLSLCTQPWSPIERSEKYSTPRFPLFQELFCDFVKISDRKVAF